MRIFFSFKVGTKHHIHNEFFRQQIYILNKNDFVTTNRLCFIKYGQNLKLKKADCQ